MMIKQHQVEVICLILGTYTYHYFIVDVLISFLAFLRYFSMMGIIFSQHIFAVTTSQQRQHKLKVVLTGPG